MLGIIVNLSYNKKVVSFTGTEVNGVSIIMERRDTAAFQRWLAKTKNTELDIIKCRKMQSLSITESENTFGISSVSVCGFENNDVIKLGGEIKQQYDESKEVYYNRVYDILIICCELMDAVNEIMIDEGAWSAGYFQKRLTEWRDEKIKSS